MSVYSGFSTRQQEVTYNRLTESMLLLLKDRIFAAERREGAPDGYWMEQFTGVYGQMNRMEAHKYFPPKLTQCVRDLAVAYGTGDWDDPLTLSTERKKPRTVVTKHRNGFVRHLLKTSSYQFQRLFLVLAARNECVPSPSLLTATSLRSRLSNGQT